MNNTDHNFKTASETISAFLADFSKDQHTNIVLDYIFSIMLGKEHELHLFGTQGQERDQIVGELPISTDVVSKD